MFFKTLSADKVGNLHASYGSSEAPDLNNNDSVKQKNNDKTDIKEYLPVTF